MDSVSRQPLVFVVDDDPDTRELYRFLLESAGYDVADASHVAGIASALEGIEPHVVLTDWLLPDGDGLAVCEQLQGKEDRPPVPILAVTGFTLSPQQRMAAQAHGIVSVLEKPVDPDDLLQAIAAAIGSEPEAARPPSRMGGHGR